MKLEAFYPHVLPEVPGCPDPLLNSRLIASAAEFCRETLSWNEVQDPIVLADGVSDYELETPTGAYVESVLSVTIGSRKLIPAAEGFVGTSTSVEPVYYNTSDYGVLRVYPTPKSLDPVTVTDEQFAVSSPLIGVTYSLRRTNVDGIVITDSGAIPATLVQGVDYTADTGLGVIRLLRLDNGGAPAVSYVLPLKARYTFDLPPASMLVKVAYTPAIDATSLPDFLKRFVDTISAGAKAQLMMMNAWVNPQMASYYRSMFMDGITRARIQDAHGRVVGPLRVKPRAFGF